MEYKTKILTIGVIDADLIGRKRHRFPNLACMKISAYYKEFGHEVELLTDYKDLQNYDKVFISKVFTDTEVPVNILNLSNVEHGGTGFYFDKAPELPYEIEHHMPDYHLYDKWVKNQLENGVKRKELKEYLDYSIGFLTRGCFRKCGFCVNQKYNHVFKHSPLEEFYDPSKPKICLLDDNFFGCPKWKEMLLELQATGKAFKFKQGLDERLLTDEKCELLCASKYDSDMTFAFDNIEDYELIESKLKILRKYTQRQFIFYVLCGFDKNEKYDKEFWIRDIEDVFKRIELLMKYGCIPYIMRFNKYKESPFRGMYITIARWCNQPSFFKKKSLREFGILNGLNSACNRYIYEYLKEVPKAEKYLDIKYENFKNNK